MDLDHIKEFIVLTKTENYLEAAENLFISQSTLSKHIKALEKELGVALFDRTTRQVTLSKAGQIYLDYAQQMVSLQHQCKTSLMNLKEAKEQNLSIGSIPIMAPYGITDLILGFKKDNVKINLTIVEAETKKLKQKLRDGECDLAFIRRTPDEVISPEDLVDFTIKSFTIDHLVVVLPINHPLADQVLIDLSDLKNEPFLLLQPKSVLYKLSVQACQKVGFTPDIVYTGKRAENIVDLVSKGMGVSLLMAKPVSYINTQNLVKVVPVLPHIETEIVIYYAKNRSLSKAASHFLEFIEHHT